jgi:mannose-1-phosphate guanylyltransferase/phosphomannomutase
MMNVKAIIIAGGLGTRLKEITGNKPKLLIDLCDKTLLDYQIDCLVDCGISKIIIVGGNDCDQIASFVRNNYSSNLVTVIKDYETQGTANAIRIGLKESQDDSIVLYGDLLFDLDFSKFIKFHHSVKSYITSLVHLSDHPSDSDLVDFHVSLQLKGIYPKGIHRNSNLKYSLAGIYLISKSVIPLIDDFKSGNFESEILTYFLKNFPKNTFVYQNRFFCKDIGTPERYHKALNFLEYETFGGFHKVSRAIFLDRDGTIIKNIPYLNDFSKIVFLDKSLQGLLLLKNMGFMIFIVTNQPGIARGDVLTSELNEIHENLIRTLINFGIIINGIYYCPHHPDSGFQGEISALKFRCQCRKPSIGMIKEITSDFNINLLKSYVVGDDLVDLELSQNIGATFLGIMQPDSIQNNIFKFSNLLEVAYYIRSELGHDDNN